MISLNDKIASLKDLGVSLPEVPVIILNNLSSRYGERPYQLEAFSRFIYYINNTAIRQHPTQLLFHMATGSGKTLIMAGCILYLYEKGYRDFIFFVNSNNIINKTRDNFLNKRSIKYLFADQIAFGSQQVKIREVETFQSSNEDCINIAFSTIQGLHTNLNNASENTITFDDFENRKIVLISDEAHHINVDTKQRQKLTKEEYEELMSWETTVNRIFQANPNNILLEFTATADLQNQNIAHKYIDKLIFDYPLKQFRKDGYSKEVKLLQTDTPDFERAIQAVLLSQYRRKLFEKYQLRIKPTILFKSKTINESRTFFHTFHQGIHNLTAKTFETLRARADNPIVIRMFQFFKSNGINLANLAEEIKEEFSKSKCLIINSKEESEEKQIAVNTLEDDNNGYRAIFAVDKLNEGWDVLNLFDIVRLYDTRDAKDGKPGYTTMSEAQLIGRGARYCPFKLEQHQSKYLRKYDLDLGHELRICEELYYHSASNPKYIQELNTALQEIGMKGKKTEERHLKLKKHFVSSEFYDKGYIFINEQQEKNQQSIGGLPNEIIGTKHLYSLSTGHVDTQIAFEDIDTKQIDLSYKDISLLDLGIPIVRKAIDKLDFYRFNNLKYFLPKVKSISKFITSKNYLGNVNIELEGVSDQLLNLTVDDKLDIATTLLDRFSEVIGKCNTKVIGSEEFKPFLVKNTFKDKILNVVINDDSDQEYGISQSATSNPVLNLDLSDKNWYVFNDNYGTSEEKYLVKFINKIYEKLKLHYDNIYLIRNESHFQLYDFDDGSPFEPDFVLFLQKKKTHESVQYQVFIEPKGEHLFLYDQWKEKFLLSLKERSRIEVLWESKTHKIWGLPFYNHQYNTAAFEKEFKELIPQETT